MLLRHVIDALLPKRATVPDKATNTNEKSAKQLYFLFLVLCAGSYVPVVAHYALIGGGAISTITAGEGTRCHSYDSYRGRSD